MGPSSQIQDINYISSLDDVLLSNFSDRSLSDEVIPTLPVSSSSCITDGKLAESKKYPYFEH